MHFILGCIVYRHGSAMVMIKQLLKRIIHRITGSIDVYCIEIWQVYIRPKTHLKTWLCLLFHPA